MSAGKASDLNFVFPVIFSILQTVVRRHALLLKSGKLLLKNKDAEGDKKKKRLLYQGQSLNSADYENAGTFSPPKPLWASSDLKKEKTYYPAIRSLQTQESVLRNTECHSVNSTGELSWSYLG